MRLLEQCYQDGRKDERKYLIAWFRAYAKNIGGCTPIAVACAVLENTDNPGGACAMCRGSGAYVETKEIPAEIPRCGVCGGTGRASIPIDDSRRPAGAE